MTTKKTTTTKVAKNKETTTIYNALFEFQSANIVIPKNGQGTGRNGKAYTYPTLDDVIKAIRPEMQKAGLVYAQIIDNNVLHTTILALHADPADNKIVSSLDLGKPASAQELGARITYARRYTLLSALGLVGDEDTDAKPEDVLPKMVEEIKAAPVHVREPSKTVETVDPNSSLPYQKAWNAIQSCKSADSMKVIQTQIENSVKLTAEEIPQLLEIISKKSF